MLNFFLSTLCAFVIMSNDAPVADKSTVFIIDGKVVENFDGSQLRDKQISEYVVETKDGKTIHRITLKPSPESAFKTSSVIYLDGKLVSADDLKNLDKNTIGNIEIIKGKAASSFGTDAEKKGVIVIKTDKIVIKEGDPSSAVIKASSKDVCYIVDGKELSAEEFKQLPTSSIKDINVYKNESEILKYTSKKVSMAIVVSTKK